MMNGESGADYIKKFDIEKFSVKFACEVKDFDPLGFLDRKEARRMGAFTHFALAASDEAMKHSGLVIDDSQSCVDIAAADPGSIIEACPVVARQP